MPVTDENGWSLERGNPLEQDSTVFPFEESLTRSVFKRYENQKDKTQFNPMDALLSKNSALAYNTNIHPIPKFEKKNSFPEGSI